MSESSTRRRPWLVLTVIAGLTLLLMPIAAAVVDRISGMAKANLDAHVLKHLVIGIRVYEQMEGGRLPSRWPVGTRLIDARSGYDATVAAMEILFASSGTGPDVLPSYRAVPIHGQPRITVAPTATGTAWLAAGVPMAIAFDWSTPSSALTTARPLLANRFAIADGMHGHGVYVAFGDSSVVWVKAAGSPGRPAATLDSSGHKPLKVDVANALAADDRIFDGVGDEGPGADPLAVGRGSATRAWLR